MRHLSMTHPKTGQVCQVSLETVPPRRLEVEPFPLIGIEAELSLRHEESMAPASSVVMLPLFGVESFSSGRPTGVMAFRHALRRSLLNGGDPEVLPANLRWEDYIMSHQALTQMGIWMSTAYSMNGLIRIRPDRMCVEIGAADLIARPDHLAGIVALLRRVTYRILSAYRDGESLPSWFGTDAHAIQDIAFRTNMLSAVKLGSAGSCYTQGGMA